MSTLLLSAQITLPYIQDFESASSTTLTTNSVGVAGISELTYQATAGGRLRTTAGAGFYNSGNKAITLDRNPAGDLASNFLIFNLDLSNYTTLNTITLDYSFMDHNDDPHGDDKVSVRGSSSDSWIIIEDWNTISGGNDGVYINRLGINISSILAGNGQNYSSTFQLRFGQEDDFPALSTTSLDGVTFDDIALNIVYSECNSATLVACGDTVNGATTGDTPTGAGTCGTTEGTGGAIWYKIIGNGNNWTVSTITGTDYDSKIWVFSGNCGALNCVSGDDNSGVGNLSSTTFATTYGEDYFIAIGGAGSAQGNYTLSFNDNNGCTLVPCAIPILTNRSIDSCGWATINGNTYTTSKIITDTLFGMSSEGCDSIIITDLTIYNKTFGNHTINDCDSALYSGIKYYNNTTFNDTLVSGNSFGCDSIITVTINLNYSNTESQNVTACDSYILNGNTYTTTQNIDDFFAGANSAGCDSVLTTNLIINYSSSSFVQFSGCDSFTLNANTYIQSTTVIDTMNNANLFGCDSIVTTEITINESISTTIDTTIINGQTITINGINFTEQGLYTIDTLTTSEQCDSIILLQVRIVKGINENLNSISTFINSNKQLTINSSYDKLESISIYNSNGLLLISDNNINSKSKKIDLSTINDGILFVKILSNKTLITKKVLLH